MELPVVAVLRVLLYLALQVLRVILAQAVLLVFGVLLVFKVLQVQQD
jgi:hypothetical protein